MDRPFATATAFHSHNDNRERLMTCLVYMAPILVTGFFLWLVGDLLYRGLSSVSLAFLLEAPTHAGRSGGIAPVLTSTLWILAVCLAVSVPLGLSTAIFLSEYTRRESGLGRFVRLSLDVLAGVPSIVFGLFGNAFFCIYLGMGFSILSGGLTLACMVLPLLVRFMEEGLRAVPESYRLGASALGMTRLRILVVILLPAAAPGLVVGLVLAIGRALAETAALVFTSGYVARMPNTVMDSGRALSVHIYDLAMNVAGGEKNAYATAVVLVVMLTLINWFATTLAHRSLRRGVMEG